MKNKKFLIAIFSLCLINVNAQYQLNGTILDEADGSPVSFATVALLHPDSSAMTGVISNDNGKFLIQNITAGSYILCVSFLGYEKEYRNVNLPEQNDLGEIRLRENANALNEVIITGTRPLMVIRADRYIVNVSGNIQSAGRNATDILRNTPGLIVDNNGDISMMGKGVQVWIDGRPSNMSGEQLKAFLNSMQGGEIDRIEVVTNPSSRYEAEGSGGIIDIKTQKGLQFGLNGILTTGYQQGRVDRENAGVNMNWRREYFNIFGNYSINRNNLWNYLNQNNLIQTQEGKIRLDQNTTVQNAKAGIRNSLRAGMDYFLNSNNIIGIIVNAYNSDDGIVNIKGVTDISPAYDGVNYSTANNIKTNNSDGIQVNMNYQSTFAKIGRQLNLDIDVARFNSSPLQQNVNKYYDINNTMIGNVEQFSNANPQTIDVYSAKLDYTEPIWKDTRMEIGAKISQSTTDNDLKYEEFIGNVGKQDIGRNNRFIYNEQIRATYININQQIGKFNLQAGFRGEYTYSKGEQKTTNVVNDTTYFNLFPTFFINYPASPKNILGLSYSRRLSRPNFDVLNPFEITVDAYSFLKGNPNLTPAYTHNLQLTHMFNYSLMTLIGYSSTKNLIMQAPIVDDATHRTGVIWRNFGDSKNITVMANYRKTIRKIWTANMTAQGVYQINTSNEISGEFVSEGSSLILQLNNNITVTPSLSAEVNGLYVSGMRLGYFVMRPQGNFSIGLRQMLLKNKMILSFIINDILNTSKSKLRAQYENVNYYADNGWDSRYFNITLRYNFGSTSVKEARNKSTGIEDETIRVGSK